VEKIKMEDYTEIISILWDILSKNKKSAVNVITKENEIIVSILSGRRWKRFKNSNADILADELKLLV